MENLFIGLGIMFAFIGMAVFVWAVSKIDD